MINYKKITYIITPFILILLGFYIVTINYNKIEILFNKDCKNLGEENIENLNQYFKNTNYKGNYNYWCNLKEIDINKGENLYNKQLPDDFYKLVNLKFFIIKNTNFGGFTDKINNLEKLISIDISNNNLNGKLTNLNLKKLEFLNISGNNLEINKNNFISLEKLEYLNIKNNNYNINEMKNFSLKKLKSFIK